MSLNDAKALLALQLLIEGNSIRSTERITGVDRNTIMKLLVLAGEKCEKFMGRLLVNIPARDVECDEIWVYVGKKEGHKWPEEANDAIIGDAYCLIAIERHSKLVLNFALGRGDQATTDVFVEGLRAATAPKPFQVTTDGFAPYRSAITTTLHDRVGFAQLIKVYRAPQEGEARYSPAEVASTEVVPVYGRPDPERICTYPSKLVPSIVLVVLTAVQHVVIWSCRIRENNRRSFTLERQPRSGGILRLGPIQERYDSPRGQRFPGRFVFLLPSGKTSGRTP